MPIFNGTDDIPLTVERQNFSGGINTRQAARQIGENQCEDISNFDVSIPGEFRKDAGSTLIEDLGSDPGTGLFGFEPAGGTNVLVATHGAKLETWPGTGTFTERKTNFTSGLATTLIKVEEEGIGDVFLAGNGTDNWFRFDPANYSSPQDLGSTAGTGSDSPPKSAVASYFRNRLWVLKDNLGYFSAPYPADYAVAFDTVSDAFRIPVGPARAILGLRDQGLVFIGRDQIWGLNPSVIPDPTSDKPEKLLDIGCVAGKTAVQVGDDVFFLAKDGVRGLFRTQQDKLQTGQAFPLTYVMKTQFESINWAYAQNACAVYFDNKYLLAVPTNSATYNNQVWIYYPALQCWRIRDGWNVASFATMKVSGEERLYFIDSTTGHVSRAFYGTNEDGTVIHSSLIGREEDFKYPGQYKVGGELEISVLTVSDPSTLEVSVSLDGQGFQSLGSVDLESGTAPSLPVDLPFYLSDESVKYHKFHLESLGRFRTIQVMLENSDDIASPIIIYGYTMKTYLEEYENE